MQHTEVPEIRASDPTRLTTELVDKAIRNLESRLDTRFMAMDKAAELLHNDLTRFPTDFDRQTNCLRELVFAEISKLKATTDEVFERINVQFVERDKRTEQLAIASSTAIAAALQAAKEAVGAQNTSNSIAIAKSESSTIESIRQLQTLFDTSMSGLRDQMDDIKSRIDKAEGQVKGAGAIWGFAIGIIGAIFGLVGIVGFFMKFVGQ